MTSPAPATPSAFIEETLAELTIDGRRRQVVWIHDEERSVSVLIDRPISDTGEALLLGTFGAAEGREAIDALLADYRENYAARPPGERPRPRALEPADLLGAR